MTTTVCARFESTGKPGLTLTLEDETVVGVLKRLAQWMSETAMGHVMRITVARTMPELEQATRSNRGGSKMLQSELLSEFTAELDALGLDDDIFGELAVEDANPAIHAAVPESAIHTKSMCPEHRMPFAACPCGLKAMESN